MKYEVVDPSHRDRKVQPWADPTGSELGLLRVYATVAHGPRSEAQKERTPAARWFNTGAMDAEEFLSEVLTGERTWHPRNVLARYSALWALQAEVEEYRAKVAETAQPPALQVPEQSVVEPVPVPVPESEPLADEADEVDVGEASVTGGQPAQDPRGWPRHGRDRQP